MIAGEPFERDVLKGGNLIATGGIVLLPTRFAKISCMFRGLYIVPALKTRIIEGFVGALEDAGDGCSGAMVCFVIPVNHAAFPVPFVFCL